PLVAAMNEFGVPSNHQPPRPFFRRTIIKRAEAWVKNFGTAMKFTKGDVERSFGLVGQGMKEDVQQGIRDLTSPPLSPVTIARKGFEKPLIETSNMVNTVAFRVTSGEKK